MDKLSLKTGIQEYADAERDGLGEHLEDGLLMAYLAGDLVGKSADLVADHLALCEECTESAVAHERFLKRREGDVKREKDKPVRKLPRFSQPWLPLTIAAAFLIGFVPMGLLYRDQLRNPQATTHLASLPVLDLPSQRVVNRAEGPELLVLPRAKMVTLILSPEALGDDAGFSVVLFRGETVIWRADDLHPTPFQNFSIGLNTEELAVGEYVLVLSGNGRELDRFPFRLK